VAAAFGGEDADADYLRLLMTPLTAGQRRAIVAFAKLVASDGIEAPDPRRRVS
jgi:hypothetical protein